MVAALRITEVLIGGRPGAALLGPLAVHPNYRGQGFGRQLVREALEEMREAGIKLVVLVGDEPYYGPLGFVPVPLGEVTLPGPVNPGRILAAELEDERAQGVSRARHVGREIGQGFGGSRQRLIGIDSDAAPEVERAGERFAFVVRPPDRNLGAAFQQHLVDLLAHLDHRGAAPDIAVFDGNLRPPAGDGGSGRVVRDLLVGDEAYATRNSGACAGSERQVDGNDQE